MSELPPTIALIDTNVGADDNILSQMEIILESVDDSPSKMGEAVDKVCLMLFDLSSPGTRESFINYLAKKYKITKKTFATQLKFLADSRKSVQSTRTRTDGENSDEENPLGWYILNNCYWFYTATQHDFKCSNFIIKPLFHIDSITDNKRLVEIVNYLGYTRVLEIPSKNFLSVELFSQYVFCKGDFLFYGQKGHYMRILDHISINFPVCEELRTLGWMREGFYAFANGIFHGVWQPVNDFGITEFKNKKYFTAAFSSIYKNVRDDDDEYENDRYFVWNQSPISFGTWTKLMLESFNDNGMIGIAYAVATVFRDIIFEKYKIFPHLFLFGTVQSGKSTLAWSLSNLFFHNKPTFNLSSGTQVGFDRNLARVKNALIWVDEYYNDIDPRRFQSLKGAYDGAGSEKGKMTQDNRTKTTKINGSLAISGQHMPTADDNALLTRAILLMFQKHAYTEVEMNAYNKLKDYELAGISSLLGDILNFRSLIDQKFGIEFTEVQEQLKSDLIAEKLSYDERLVRNYACILTPIRIISKEPEGLKFNFTYEYLYQVIKKNLSDQSKQVSSSESVAGFWQTVEYLLDEGRIANNIDFKISTLESIKVTLKSGDLKNVDFTEPTKLLCIRLSRIHPLYMEKHRQQTGRNGIDMVSIIHYMKGNKSYVGHSDQVRFDNSNSSAFVFKFGPGELDVNLERLVMYKPLPGTDLPADVKSVVQSVENPIVFPPSPDQEEPPF